MSKNDTQKITDTLKELAITAVNNTKPTTICFGTVTKVSPLTILVDAKLPLTPAFLVLTETVRNKEIKIGNRMILIRMQGGQKFIVLDRM